MIAPVLTNGLTIRLTGDIISRPYINLTLQLMNDFGVRAEWTDDHRLKVEPQAYHSTPFYVESDWSAASYWYQIVALSKEAEVTLPGLFKDSYQGDSQVAGIFRSLGVETIYKDKTVILKKEWQECGKAGLRLYQPTRPGTNICCDLCVTKYPFPLLRPAKFENQRNRPHGCTDNGNEETGVYTP